MKRFSIILMLLSIPFVLSAQKYYSKSELVADMDTLYARINEIHPDMFARISREEFEKRFVHAKETMPDSLDAVGFYRIIAPLVSSLQDGHTGVFISDNDYRNSILYVLPDCLGITKDGRLIICRSDFTESVLDSRFNNEFVRSINGISSEEFINMVLSLKFGAEHFRVQWANEDMISFSVALNAPEYRIEYECGDSVQVAVVKGIEYNELVQRVTDFNAAKQHKRKEGDNKPVRKRLPFEYRIHEPLNTAIFTLKSFSYGNGALDGFLRDMFSDIKKKHIKDLVIDIRDNGGGDSGVGDEIFQYISRRKFRQFDGVTVKISAPAKREYNEWSEFDNGTTQSFISKNSRGLKRLRKNRYRFNGDVYLLTDNGTFSSGTSFACAFRYYDMGMIVGEKCGEPIADFGDVLTGHLPNTGLYYSVSYKMFLFAGATEDDVNTFVLPDVEVSSARALDEALKIIAEKHSKDNVRANRRKQE